MGSSLTPDQYDDFVYEKQKTRKSINSYNSQIEKRFQEIYKIEFQEAELYKRKQILLKEINNLIEER